MADKHTAMQRSMAGLADDLRAARAKWEALVAEGAADEGGPEVIGAEETEAIFAAARDMTRETAILCGAVETMKSVLSGMRRALGITPHCPCHACHEDAQKPAAAPPKRATKGTGMVH